LRNVAAEGCVPLYPLIITDIDHTTATLTDNATVTAVENATTFATDNATATATSNQEIRSALIISPPAN
jgi:hypothetical protein